MPEARRSDIDEKVRKSLEGTIFESIELTPLSGGSVNWTYVAKLLKPLDDGTKEIVVKHGEKYPITMPDYAVTLIRCRVENECFKCLSNSPFNGRLDSEGTYNITVRTPKHYHFDQESTNQISEFLPNGTTLKDHILKYYVAPAPLEHDARQIGKSLGAWLKGFAQWSTTNPELRTVVEENIETQNIRHTLHFEWLSERVEQYPAILQDAKDIFAEVEAAAVTEKKDQSKLQIVHGDLWPGNILIPDAPLSKDSDVPIFIIDWEMAHLGLPDVDLGQMIAEFYTIWLYKNIPASLWMMEEFISAYGEITEEFAFRTAIRAGAHLLCVISIMGWGTPEQIENAVAIGRDIIIRAWKKDRHWFEDSELSCLFRQAT